MKSDIEIKTDVFDHIYGSELRTAVTGSLRKTGKRPHNSDKEDIVISVLSNTNGQIQNATVNVNIYVPALIVDDQPEEDTIRLKTLCDTSSSVLGRFYGKDFIAELRSQHVYEVESARSYVINNRIEYKQSNE